MMETVVISWFTSVVLIFCIDINASDKTTNQTLANVVFNLTNSTKTMTTLYVVAPLFNLTNNNTKPIPASIFFSSFNENEAQFNTFLCHRNPELPKCCNCMRICNKSCCIDAFWNEFSGTNLLDYILLFIKAQSQNKIRKTCQPALTPLPSGHRSQNLLMVTYLYVDSKNQTVDCIRFDIEVPFFSRSNAELYVNQECGTKNGALDLVTMIIDVNCKSSNQLFNENEEFSPSLQSNLQDCLYEAEIPRSLKDRENVECSDDCLLKNDFIDLCNIFVHTDEKQQNTTCKNCLAIDNRLYSTQCNNIFIKEKHVDPSDKNKKKGYDITFQIYANIKNQILIKNVHFPFPVGKFFGLDGTAVHDTLYSDTLLCNGTNTSTKKCCNCDATCSKFKSCCVDKFWNPARPVNVSDYKTLLTADTLKYKNHNCQNAISMAGHQNNAKYLIVQSCLEEASEESKENCMKEVDKSEYMIPVVGEDQYLYRNIHCAQCNNVNRYSPVRIVATCPNAGDEFDSFDRLRYDCWYAIHPTDILIFRLKPCSNENIKKSLCPKTNKYYLLCNAYQGTYRLHYNFHCYQCTRERRRNLLIRVSKPSTCNTFKETGVWLYSVTFEIKDKIKIEAVRTNKDANVKFCDNEYFFHMFSANCYAITPTLAPYLVIQVKIDFYNCFSRRQRFSYVELKFNSTLDINQDGLTLLYQSAEKYVFRVSSNNLNIDMKKVQLFISHQHDPVLNSYYNASLKHSFPDEKLCHRPIVVHENEVKFDYHCNVLYGGKEYHNSDVTLMKHLNANGYAKLIILCEKFHLNAFTCNLTHIKDDLSPDTDGNITLRNGITYAVEEYIPHKHDVEICWVDEEEEEKVLDWIQTMNKVHAYLVYTGICVNIIGYVFVLIQFFISMKARTTETYITICIALNLFLSDTIYFIFEILVKTHGKLTNTVCMGIAFCMEFASVKAHLWAIMLAFHSRLSSMVTLFSYKEIALSLFITFNGSFGIIFLPFMTNTLQFVSTNSTDLSHCDPDLQMIRFYTHTLASILMIIIGIFFIIRNYVKDLKSYREIDSIEFNKIARRILLLPLQIITLLVFDDMINFTQVVNAFLSQNETGYFETILKILHTIFRSLRGCSLLFIKLSGKKGNEKRKRYFFSQNEPQDEISLPNLDEN